MKITCTLSEYTKLARQCGETKARFNCRNCPLNGLLELPEGESCDIERFVQEITMPNDITIRNPLEGFVGEVPEAIKGAILPRARGERLESR